jgi:frataxin
MIEDSHYSDGVLNIEMRGKMYYVLNKQTPNRQIWLSSPISGPSRFEYKEGDGTWLHYRTNECLLQLLNYEFNERFAKKESEKIELKYDKINNNI